MTNVTEEQLLAEVMTRCGQRGIAAVHISAPHHNRAAEPDRIP
jgi:hypothetical protein